VGESSGRQWTQPDLELSFLTTMEAGVACGTGTNIIAPPNDIKVARQESLRIWYGRTMSTIDVNFGALAFAVCGRLRSLSKHSHHSSFKLLIILHLSPPPPHSNPTPTPVQRPALPAGPGPLQGHSRSPSAPDGDPLQHDVGPRVRL
jgi:hypothetical protein